MYDLSGLYYKAIVDGLVFGLGGISFVIGSRFWNAEKKKIKELLTLKYLFDIIKAV